MRLTTKLTLILALVIACGLIAQSFLHVRRVRALHSDEMRDDLETLASTLSAATSEIWASLGQERAREYVARADARRTRTRIALIGPQDGPHLVTLGHVRPTYGETHTVAYAPVIVLGATVALLELTRSREAERSFVRQLILTQILTVVLILVACVVLALMFGMRLVGRPVERLIAQARRVAAGDFTLNRQTSRRDELGRLAHELNVMTEHLSAAEKRAREERRMRTQAFEQLRHADRLSSVGKLASGIAHELGTPLNVVSGRASMICADASASENAIDNAKTIVEQSEHMADILRQLLDFSRRGLKKTAAKPREVLEDAISLIEPLAEEQSVEVEVTYAVDTEAEIDSGKTLQVLTNLIMNGIQAMPNGGKIFVDAQTRAVDAPPDRRSAPGDFLCFSVRDQGDGIAAEDVERVFEPFFTTKGAGEGTGMGLSVCHGIVREHGGWMEVESEPGQGSCFRVYLPLGATS